MEKEKLDQKTPKFFKIKKKYVFISIWAKSNGAIWWVKTALMLIWKRLCISKYIMRSFICHLNTRTAKNLILMHNSEFREWPRKFFPLF